MLGLIPFPKAIDLSINSNFDVPLDNAFKVEQKVKYKSDLGITVWCIQWNISRCVVEKAVLLSLKYKHIIYNFEPLDTDISNM